jgi:AmiR/NasT family two-component response regulator
MSPRSTEIDRIAQAQGVVSVQADCSMDEALALMKDRAVSTHATLVEIADSVIDRLTRFGK